MRAIIKADSKTNSWDKIRLKSGPKQYKSGPKPTGKVRLQQRVNRLLLDAARLERKPCTTLEDEVGRDYASKLAEALMNFNTAMGTDNVC